MYKNLGSCKHAVFETFYLPKWYNIIANIYIYIFPCVAFELIWFVRKYKFCQTITDSHSNNSMSLAMVISLVSGRVHAWVGFLWHEIIIWKLFRIHTQKSTSDYCLFNQYQIIFAIFRLISNQMEFRLVQNQSENAKYNLISVSFTRIRGRLFCAPVIMHVIWIKIVNSLCYDQQFKT